MSYQMPIVCKEVFLPITDSMIDQTLTASEYKEITGVDLDDLFQWNSDGELIVKPRTKIYIVFDTSVYYGANVIVPLQLAWLGTRDYKQPVNDGSKGVDFEITSDGAGHTSAKFSAI